MKIISDCGDRKWLMKLSAATVFLFLKRKYFYTSIEVPGSTGIQNNLGFYSNGTFLLAVVKETVLLPPTFKCLAFNKLRKVFDDFVSLLIPQFELLWALLWSVCIPVLFSLLVVRINLLRFLIMRQAHTREGIITTTHKIYPNSNRDNFVLNTLIHFSKILFLTNLFVLFNWIIFPINYFKNHSIKEIFIDYCFLHLFVRQIKI